MVGPLQHPDLTTGRQKAKPSFQPTKGDKQENNSWEGGINKRVAKTRKFLKFILIIDFFETDRYRASGGETERGRQRIARGLQAIRAELN